MVKLAGTFADQMWLPDNQAFEYTVLKALDTSSLLRVSLSSVYNEQGNRSFAKAHIERREHAILSKSLHVFVFIRLLSQRVRQYLAHLAQPDLDTDRARCR